MKFIILGCGSSMGVPRTDGFFGKCNPKNPSGLGTPIELPQPKIINFIKY